MMSWALLLTEPGTVNCVLASTEISGYSVDSLLSLTQTEECRMWCCSHSQGSDTFLISHRTLCGNCAIQGVGDNDAKIMLESPFRWCLCCCEFPVRCESCSWCTWSVVRYWIKISWLYMTLATGMCKKLQAYIIRSQLGHLQTMPCYAFRFFLHWSFKKIISFHGCAPNIWKFWNL